METVTLTIDDVEVTVPKGTTVFHAAESVGIKIPHFCYHPDLPIAGVCRMCLVEIEKMPKLATSCSTVAGDGMVVRTSHSSDKVRQAVKDVLELHFINHPIDCPICDQAGECSLQDYYWDYGLYTSRFGESKVTNPKHRSIGPMVVLDADRCILCSRCVRFCREVPKTEELCIVNRGDHAEISLGTGKTLDNAYSANVVDICPVGAHTLADFRFKCRSWYLTRTPSVCPGCARGCAITIDHRNREVYRLKPRRNPEVNKAWMCDEARFLYKKLYQGKRIEMPRIRGNEASWDEAFAAVADALKEAGGDAAFLGSPHATNEENWLLRKVAETVKSKAMGVGFEWAEKGEDDEILRRADLSPNRQGAQWILGDKTLKDITEGAKALVVLADNPLKDAPAEAKEAFNKANTTIVLATHEDETTESADIVLPIASFAERGGTFTNFEGWTQRGDAAIPPPGQARPAVDVLAGVVVALGKKTKDDLAALFDELAGKTKELKGLKHKNLGELGAASPLKAKEDGK